jgi:cell division protein FtsA
MYSTTIGLVLAGFRAIDDRENRYQEVNASQVLPIKEEKPKRIQDGGGQFLKKIIDRTKGLLIDDLDDKSDY